MTAYELLDLRKGYMVEMLGMFKFWVSVTFALLVAAHVANVGMGIWGVVAATTLYSILSIAFAVTIKRFGAVLFNLMKDIAALNEKTEVTSSTLGDTNMSAPFTNTLLGIQCFGFVGAIAYLLFRAGFLG